MEITLNNYELFAVDYLEGNLNAIQTAKFILFLEQHPGIKEEIENFEKLVLPAEDIIYDAKAKLKRENFQTKQSLEILLIKKVENDLNDAEENHLQYLLASQNQVKKELKLFQKTILSPDFNLVFDNKRSLKRKAGGPSYWYYAAAAILLGLVIYPFLSEDKTKTIRLSEVKRTETAKTQSPITWKNGHGVPSVLDKKKPHIVSKKIRDTNFNRIGSENLGLLVGQPATHIDQIALTDNVLNYPELLPVDAIVRNNQENIIQPASANVFGEISSDVFLTPRQLLFEKVKKTGASVVVEENKPMGKMGQKINKFDLLAIAVKAYSSLSGKKTQVKKIYNVKGELAQLALLSEKFEYSQTK